MQKPRFVLLAVIRTSASIAAARPADHHRKIHFSAGAVKHRGGVVHDLVEPARNKVNELHLDHHWPPAHRKTDCRSHNSRLADRRIQNAHRTVFVLQTFGGSKRAAQQPDIFADANHFGVALHLFVNRLTNRREHIHGLRLSCGSGQRFSSANTHIVPSLASGSGELIANSTPCFMYSTTRAGKSSSVVSAAFLNSGEYFEASSCDRTPRFTSSCLNTASGSRLRPSPTSSSGRYFAARSSSWSPCP